MKSNTKNSAVIKAKEKKTLRCAIYTRKSHEEGLEQDFNSLDAQREAAEAYIRSQQHEGWVLVDEKYDDGGYSGGNLKRPALVRLLADINYGKVDIVVVYKVGRLSRSLADFSRLIEDFDQKAVSFVSVTQQFNTSSSMGRLTLNVLLSFAQFEREVTSERIRDKIGASKRKGMWMGGNPPMGYQVKDRSLVMIPAEVDIIKLIFTEYLDHGSLIKIAGDLAKKDITTKQWFSQTGKQWGGKRITPKYLYRILINPVYIGQIVHHSKTYPGLHQPIIDRDLWDQVQRKITSQNDRKKLHQLKSPFLLKGLLRHYDGSAMSPSTVQRKKVYGTKGECQRSVRYYVSQLAIKYGYDQCDLKSINAEHIEGIVVAAVYSQIKERLDGDSVGVFLGLSEDDRNQWFRRCIDSVILKSNKLSIDLDKAVLEKLAFELSQINTIDSNDSANASIPTLHYKPKILKSDNPNLFRLVFDIQIKKLDGKRWLIDPSGRDIVLNSNKIADPAIGVAFGQAYGWRKLMGSGAYSNAKELARYLKVSYSMLLRHLNLITLAPDIQYRALSGELPLRVSVKQLMLAAQHLDWNLQRDFLRV